MLEQSHSCCETEQDHDSLLPLEPGILVRRIAEHAIVQDILRVCHGIAPERLLLDPEATHDSIGDVRQSQRNGSTIAVFAGDVVR